MKNCRGKSVPKDDQYEKGDDSNLELAQWLQDSGRRRTIRLNESPEELLKYLEELTGEKLSSREHILAYFGKLQGQKAERREAKEKRRTVREAVLVVLLAVAFMQYYFLDVNLQLASVRSVYFFVPVPAQAPAKHSEGSYLVLNS